MLNGQKEFDMCAMNIEEYALDSESYWPESHRRNSVKLWRFIHRGAGGETYGLVKDYLDKVHNLAKLRHDFCPQHVYIVNSGSSGSHWLEAMLGLFSGFYNGGEIYLPNKIIDHLSQLSREEAGIFIDALYLIHSGGIHGDSLTASLSNSAHIASHQRISDFSLSKKTILLLRNPVDVVMSRTFRKDEYKADKAPAMSREAYLEENCLYFEKFYNGLDMKSFDVTLKYEELKEEPHKEMRKLASILSLKEDDVALNKIVEKTSESVVKDLVAKGEQPVTNVYVGERKEESWARSYVKERLGSISKKLGY